MRTVELTTSGRAGARGTGGRAARPKLGREAVDIFCRGFRHRGGDFEVKKYDILPSVGAGSLLTISQAKNTGEIGKNTSKRARASLRDLAGATKFTKIKK